MSATTQRVYIVQEGPHAEGHVVHVTTSAQLAEQFMTENASRFRSGMSYSSYPVFDGRRR